MTREAWRRDFPRCPGGDVLLIFSWLNTIWEASKVTNVSRIVASEAAIPCTVDARVHGSTAGAMFSRRQGAGEGPRGVASKIPGELSCQY